MSIQSEINPKTESAPDNVVSGSPSNSHEPLKWPIHAIRIFQTGGSGLLADVKSTRPMRTQGKHHPSRGPKYPSISRIRPVGKHRFCSVFKRLLIWPGPTPRTNPGAHSIDIRAEIATPFFSLVESLSAMTLLALIVKVRRDSAFAFTRAVDGK